ncbi:MAG: tetratricopeptide repeat protein [Gemmatimonadales bacterium]
MFHELIRRRIPQVLGVYLAAGWGLLEFADWVERREVIEYPLTDGVLFVWLFLLPIILLAAWRLAPNSFAADRPETSDPASLKSVAVLPFQNFSRSPDTEFLSDGITEEVINALTKVDGLQVVSRTTAFAYKARSEDVRTIGRQLNVGSVLEGSVQLSGTKLRVTTQLVQVANGFHLWSERYDRQLDDIFAIEDEIAENVVGALRVILSEEDRRTLVKVPRANVEAYEYYLRGRQYFHQTRRKSLEFAQQMFARAIEVDPDYALAYAGLANAAALTHMYYPGDASKLTEADRASDTALALDPGLAEAHAARGFTLALLKRFDEAEAEFKTAIRLDPKLFEARYFYARACFQQGRLDDAARLFEEAAAVREDYQAAFFAAQSHEALGNRDLARTKYQEALSVAEKHMKLNPDDPRAATMRAVSLCRLGRKDEGLHWAKQALALDPEDGGVRYNVACLYALEGETEKAITTLDEAIRVGFGNKAWIEHDPDLDSVRHHPRFKALLQTI